jgi:hypothetical protein
MPLTDQGPCSAAVSHRHSAYAEHVPSKWKPHQTQDRDFPKMAGDRHAEYGGCPIVGRIFGTLRVGWGRTACLSIPVMPRQSAEAMHAC